MRFHLDTAGVSPVLAALSLVASAAVLAGGFFAAQAFYAGQDDVPDVGTWGDEGNDRILIVQGDSDVQWQGLELRTDRPARASLQGAVSLRDGTLSPGGRFVALEGTADVAGGDALTLCAVGQAGTVAVTLRDAASKVVLFEQAMDVGSCPLGTPGSGELGSPGATDAGHGGGGRSDEDRGNDGDQRSGRKA